MPLPSSCSPRAPHTSARASQPLAQPQLCDQPLLFHSFAQLCRSIVLHPRSQDREHLRSATPCRAEQKNSPKLRFVLAIRLRQRIPRRIIRIRRALLVCAPAQTLLCRCPCLRSPNRGCESNASCQSSSGSDRQISSDAVKSASGESNGRLYATSVAQTADPLHGRITSAASSRLRPFHSARIVLAADAVIARGNRIARTPARGEYPRTLPCPPRFS